MKKLIVILISIVLLLSACQPSFDQARANYCENLGNFAQAVVNLRQLDENSTVDELKQTRDEAVRAWERLADSAGDLADAQYGELEQAFRELERTVDDIPNDASLGDALTVVRLASLETMAEYSDIAATTCAYGQQ